MKILTAFFLVVIGLAFLIPPAEAKPRKSAKKTEAADTEAQPDEQPASEGSNYSREGVAAAKAGNWDKAIENFKRAIAADPKNRDADYNLALAYSRRGQAQIKKEKWQDAISDFDEVLKRRDEDVVARRFRAFTNLQLKNYDKAIEDYNELTKRNPKDTEALLRRSYAYEATGKRDEALSDVEATLQIQPTSSDALNRKKRLAAMKTSAQASPAGAPSPAVGRPSPLGSPSASASPH
jgi:tetratricopeptide (TPR) repeat protein